MNGFIAAFAALLCFGFTATSTLDSKRTDNIDNVIANAAFNKVMPVTALGYAEFYRQETERLEYLKTLLRSRDVTDWPEELRTERMKNIERLHAYRLQGKFPINYDHPGKQLPCFYDRDGNLCAVANLIARSAGMDLVREINSRYQYATVSEMKMPEIDRWIAQSGLTRDEVITIQAPSPLGGDWIGGMAVRIGGTPVRMGIPIDSLSLVPHADTTAPMPIERKDETFPDLTRTTVPADTNRSSLGAR